MFEALVPFTDLNGAGMRKISESEVAEIIRPKL